MLMSRFATVHSVDMHNAWLQYFYLPHIYIQVALNLMYAMAFRNAFHEPKFDGVIVVLSFSFMP